MADFVTLIAGNICAGKSELLRYIKAKISEPDRVVEETIRENALRLFYLTRKVNSEARKTITDLVENSFLKDRVMNHLDIKYASGKHYIDRGIIEGAETFALNSFQEGNLTHDDYTDYLRNLRKGLDQLDRTEQDKWLEKLIVYLEVKEPPVLHERYQRRKRKDEQIDMEYLKRLNERYTRLFDTIGLTYEKYGLRQPQVLRIPASADFDPEKLGQYHTLAWEQIQQKMKEMGAV